MDYKSFSELGINDKILQAVEEVGYEIPTPVQEEAIPLALAGNDLLVQAPTGTGKTAAFALPILNAIDVSIKGAQAIILCPTRELAMQITAELKKLAAHLTGVSVVAVYGGQNIDRQFASLRKKPQIIVGTTGRVMDHIRRGTLELSCVATLVLDEADEMLDMGFKEDIDFILQSARTERQTMLFSATIPPEILEISKKYQRNPVSVKTTCDGMELPPITQYVVRVREDTKYDVLKAIINNNNYKNVLIFCNTKARAAQLNEKLNKDFYLSVALHGDLRQRERDKVMKAFRDHAVNILVATDVAARGIDVDGIEAIINFDIPFDEEFYIHRIGRTARAKADGASYSLATGRERANVEACEKAAKTVMKEYSIDGKTEVIKETSVSKNAGGRKEYPVPTIRFFINVGEKDGGTVENVKAYFVASTSMEEKDVYDVTLRDLYGFIEVDKKFENEIMGLIGQKCFKRTLAVEVSAARGEKKGRNAERAKSAKGGDYHSNSNRKPREYAKKEFGDKKPYGDKKEGYKRKTSADGDDKGAYPKKEYGDKKPYAKKEYGDKKPYAKKENGDKKPYAKKENGDKKPYAKREGKPYEKRDGDKKPYAKKEFGDKKPYAKREGKPYAKREGDKKPYPARDAGSRPPRRKTDK